MADTGQEMAEGAARMTLQVAERMLERHFMLARMERMRASPHEIERSATPTDSDEYACYLEVRPIRAEDLDLRAHEVLDALERTGATGAFHVDDEQSAIVLSVPKTSLETTQRALERLHADRTSDFTITEVSGLDTLEGLTGHRTLSPSTKRQREKAGRTGTRTHDTARAEDEPSVVDNPRDEDHDLEHVTLTFANHPESLGLNERDARAYAERMRDLGYDVHVGEPVGHACVVAVTYPIAQDEQFVRDSTVVLRDIGALAHLTGGLPAILDQQKPVREEGEPGLEQAPTTAEVRKADRPDGEPMAELADEGEPTPLHGETDQGATGIQDIDTYLFDDYDHEEDIALEVVEVTFAGDPMQDRVSAGAYARTMQGLGYEVLHREYAIPGAARHTVTVFYPHTRRDEFAQSHVDTTHRIGARASVAVTDEPVMAPMPLELMVDALEQEATPTDAQGYLALSPTERACIPAERIPDGAFGTTTIADAIRCSREVSLALKEQDVPERLVEAALTERV